MSLKEEILDLSRQSMRGALSPWFDHRLDEQIDQGVFLPGPDLEHVAEALTRDLRDYRLQTGVGTAVLGMSGGVDSALTAALLKRAGWRVIGHTLPIDQDPEETERGIEACEALGLDHVHLDLTSAYSAVVESLGDIDAAMPRSTEEPHRIRRGNMRARLRMITLYDQAHRHGGLVVSTDNFSELAAGFWTLHGDVGDLAPVQSLLKSWEVPWIARFAGVPERTWRAKPTDGLGISSGDEAQIGASYLEFDILVRALFDVMMSRPNLEADDLAEALELDGDAHAAEALQAVLARLRGTWFKRISPIQLDHPSAERFSPLDMLDARLFRPTVLRSNRAVAQFSGELPPLAAQLVRLARDHGVRIVTAESCTAGLIAACIAEAPGSSAALEGSIVSYCSTMKIDALGVRPDLIEENTPYHPDVAAAMAQGALDRAPAADLALAVTGVAGPGPDQGKPAGLVYVACARRGASTEVRELRLDGRPKAILAAIVADALSLAIAALTDNRQT